MRKNLLIAIMAIFLFVLVGCTKGNDNSGTITVKVYDLNDNEVFNGDILFTENDTLLKLLQDHKTISLKGEVQSWGFFITEVAGIKSNDYPSTFWSIEVNGNSSLVGISDINLNDKDVIVFSLTAYLAD